MDKGKALIIAVAHQKGGTGKTTTVCNLAACLGMAGESLSVAVIDLDAQGTATSHLNGARHFSSGSYQIIVGTKSVSEVALPTGIRNCFIVPATNSLVLCEMDPVIRSLSFKEVREHLLNEADAFDVLIVDCPSGLGIISTMAIAVADLVVMPTPPLAFTEEPLRATVAYIDDLQKDAASKVAIVMTMYEPKIKSQEKLVRKIRDEWGEMVVDVEIPFETLVEDAVENNAVIIEFEKSSATALAYIKLAEKLGERLGLELDFSKLRVNSLGTNLVHGLGKLIEPQTEAMSSVQPGEDEAEETFAAPAEELDRLVKIQIASTDSGQQKLPKHLDKRQEPEDHRPPEYANNKISTSRLIYRITAFIILILSFLIVSIFIP